MIRAHWFFALCCIFALLVTGAQGAVYPADNSISVSLRFENGIPSLTETLARALMFKPAAGEIEIEAPPDPINVLSVTRDGVMKQSNFQTAPESTVYVSAPEPDVVNTAQVTTVPGYPILEMYWDYDKSPSEPWRYYMRVDKYEDGYAVYADFRTKEAWRKPITVQKINEIINSGTIPSWESVR